MHFTAAEIASWVGSFMFPLFRIGALVGTAPIFSHPSLPARIRVAIALVLTAVLAPVLPEAPAVDPFSPESLLMVANEVLVGVAIGFSLGLVFAALITGAQVIAQLMGLGFARMMDPTYGVSVPVVSQVYSIMATLLFLALDGHLLLLELLTESFYTLPIGTGLSSDKIWAVVSFGEWVFAGAVLLAAPVAASMLVVNFAFGVMTRAAPQLNIFAVGFPVTILLGFVVMTVALPSLLPQLNRLLGHAFALVRDLIGAGG